jgi:hypothetical protein
MRVIACLTLSLWVCVGHAAEPAAEPAVDTSREGFSANDGRAGQTREDATRSNQAARQAANDRLELDTTVVTGNRELPKVLYIVPWKKSDLGELPAQPFNTLLDEILTPVDRDVFRREVTYYEALSSDGPSGAAASSRSGSGSEK